MNKNAKTTKGKAKLAEKEKVKAVEEEDSEIEVPSSESEEEQSKTKLSGKRAKPEPKKAPAKAAPAKKEQPKSKKPVAKEPEEDEEEEGEEDVEEENNDNGKAENGAANGKEEAEEEEEEENDAQEEEKSPEEHKETPAEEQAEGEQAEEVEMFIGNLPFNATENDLIEFFSQYGEVTSAKIISRDGRSTGKGFIQFSTHEEAVQSKQANGQDFNGRAIQVRFSSEPAPERTPRQGFGQQRAPRQNTNNANTIFIGGLSYDSTTETVGELFGQCGNISAVRIATNPDGQPRGFAHIDFESPDSVEAALQLSGTMLDGRKIRVDVAGNKSGPSSGGFRGAPRGDRGFGGRGSRGARGGGNRGRGGFGGGMNRNKGAIQEYQGKKKKFE